MVRSVPMLIVVGSLSVSLAVLISPPPDTLAELVMAPAPVGALFATLPVNVMTG